MVVHPPPASSLAAPPEAHDPAPHIHYLHKHNNIRIALQHFYGVRWRLSSARNISSNLSLAWHYLPFPFRFACLSVFLYSSPLQPNFRVFHTSPAKANIRRAIRRAIRWVSTTWMWILREHLEYFRAKHKGKFLWFSWSSEAIHKGTTMTPNLACTPQ